MTAGKLRGGHYEISCPDYDHRLLGEGKVRADEGICQGGQEKKIVANETRRD